MIKVVKFSATWCSPCTAMGKTIASLLSDNKISITPEEIDVDVSPAVSAQYSIRSIPTLIKFVNDQEVGRITGTVSTERLLEFFNE